MSVTNDDPLMSRKQAAEMLSTPERPVTVADIAKWHMTRQYIIEFIKVGTLAKYRTSEIEALRRARAEEPEGTDQ